VSRVLIVGGTGFIGRHMAAALAAAGHQVTAVGRTGLNLAGHSEAEMAERISGHDAVINAAGLVRSHGANTMEVVHGEGAERLFRACIRAGVQRLIHISALGASSAGATLYQRSKGHALTGLSSLDWCVLRPSVVIGPGGASTAVLTALAAMPLPPRIGPGTWQVQPIHVDDLAELVARLVEHDGSLPRSLDVVGPEPITTDAVSATLRAWLGLAPRPFIPVPAPLLGLLAALGERMMDGPMNREVVAMLKAGNVSDPEPLAAVLGRSPRTLADALARHPATEADRWHARLFFIRPALRWSLGLLWVITGLLSFGLYPVEDSHRMLAQLGLHGLAADTLLYGGAGLDLGLGALLLARWRPVAVGYAMLASMAAFSLIALGLPAEYWLHPFAPLLKNLPIAAAVLAMMALEA
jgi:uncharacterized protein YbjT (DUF2867 family)